MSDVFPNEFSKFVFFRTYSRWVDDWNRREFWQNTTDRSIDFLTKKVLSLNPAFPLSIMEELRTAIYIMEVMPSMRLMWTAGPAAEKNNIAVFNCAALPLDSIEAFSEVLFILMSGSGVGVSVEHEFIYKLPKVRRQKNLDEIDVYLIEDSKYGWADALKTGMAHWFAGMDIEFDYSKIRPRGARLMTMGGRASGPEPLKRLLTYARDLILNHQGRRLSSLDCHDLVCVIAEIVVVGGVRRSSLLSLSDLQDSQMAHAKDGDFSRNNAQRFMANNSIAYFAKPSMDLFLDQWVNLIKSRAGERGIFNREGAVKNMPKRRRAYVKKNGYEYLVIPNPCGEILLLAGLSEMMSDDGTSLAGGEFCNLTEGIIRAGDTFEDVNRKIRLAAILGTIQATLTDFPYLRPGWKVRCDDERLLGVSLTGQMDNPEILTKENYTAWKETAIKTNEEFAKLLGINPAMAVTTVKPSGTVSSLVNSSAGIHPRYARYYIRRVRVSSSDPLLRMAIDQGFQVSPENGQEPNTASTWVMSFPVKAPDNSVVASEIGALDQLKNWLKCKKYYTEHNVSCTIYVKDNEWLEIGAWVFKHFDDVVGITFLPFEHSYSQAPFEEITKEQYDEMVRTTPVLDYSKLAQYEASDNTTGAKSFACSGNSCDIT